MIEIEINLQSTFDFSSPGAVGVVGDLRRIKADQTTS